MQWIGLHNGPTVQNAGKKREITPPFLLTGLQHRHLLSKMLHKEHEITDTHKTANKLASKQKKKNFLKGLSLSLILLLAVKRKKSYEVQRKTLL